MTRTTQLSKHFALWEFINSPTALRFGIDNTPNEFQIQRMKGLCLSVLEPLREYFGDKPVRILSGFRSPELNTRVGGHPESSHMKGEAGDITIPGVPNSAVWAFIQQHLNFDQLIAERLREENGAAGWVHVSFRQGGNRNEAISYLGDRIYVPGLRFV